MDTFAYFGNDMVSTYTDGIRKAWFGLVWFYGLSTIVS